MEGEAEMNVKIDRGGGGNGGRSGSVGRSIITMHKCRGLDPREFTACTMRECLQGS